ncbi:EpsG-like putative glucosyltransferase [Algoriphagus ratkowskyi]|uniref:EpsG family protein n=1 Tax=Algoriphagus ratkowskyi TaxID=57028 RepID=A0A2W7QSV3_9BACT|nr:EpsG family protein [Algoriphagus ratkowskyi]PZX50266.1 EpsG-like putative glucosyltransferase [Algoriphagus ratkowskyi]TXD75618.1 EpsG family protein [Algoriphagus ratkowskyi]
MIYLLIILYLLFFAFLYDYTNFTKGNSVIYRLSFIIFVLLAGFRYRVGGDTINYMMVYDELPNLYEMFSTNVPYVKLQPFWILVVAISKTVSNEFFILQLLQASIVNYAIFNFAKSYTKFKHTYLFLYFVCFYGYFNFEIMREALAISIFLLSIEYLQNNKLRIYFIYCIIALMFHYSAIILFFFPYLLKNKLSYILIVFVLLFGVFFNSIFYSIITSLSFNNGLVDTLISYSDYKYTFNGLISLVILYFVYPYCVEYLNNRYNSYHKLNNSYIRLYLLLGVLSTVFFIFFRFTNYLFPLIFIYITNIAHSFFRISSFRSYYRVVSVCFLIFVVGLNTSKYFVIQYTGMNEIRWYSKWYPYYSIFNKEEDTKREVLWDFNNNKN